MSEITIRPLAQSDHADWRRLWTAYLTFYETRLPD
ncbi:MAG: GNAT family N-acetyltransferase, partial [Mesorhizobium sp.]